MSTIYENELYKIKEELYKFKRIIDEFSRSITFDNHIIFSKLLYKTYNEMNDNINSVIEDITSYIPDNIKLGNITLLTDKINKLFNLFQNVIMNTLTIPKELYYLGDIFLSNYDVKFDYIMYLSNEIAVQSYNGILKNINFNELSKQTFISFLKNDYYFIVIIPEYAKFESSINWPIILHEFAHCIIKYYKIDDQYVPEYDSEKAMEIINTYIRNHIQELYYPFLMAQRKGIITEHIADLLVTWNFGSIYAWRYLNELFKLIDVLEDPLTHPADNNRIKIITEELASYQDMTQEATYINTLMEKQLKAFSTSQYTHSLDLEPELSNTINIAKKYNKYVLKPSTIKESISNSLWFKHYKPKIPDDKYDELILSLHNDLLKGRPIIIEPQIIYYLITYKYNDVDKINHILNGVDDFSKYFKEMIVDLIRIYHHQQLYVSNS